MTDQNVVSIRASEKQQEAVARTANGERVTLNDCERLLAAQQGYETLPDCLEVTAWTDDGEIMSVRHREHAIQGVQFHPESIMTEHDHRLLQNFLRG